MVDIVSSIVVFVLTLVGIVILGLIAGFSPTLYIAQVTAASKPGAARRYTLALMVGVVAAVLLLSILFQTLQLETLVQFIDSTLKAFIISVLFNIVIGIGLIIGGFWYINHRAAPKPKKEDLKKTNAGVIAIASFGFMRTLVSISGVTATYLAGNAIASASINIIEQLIYMTLFLAATVAPFAVIIVLMKRDSARLLSLTAWLQTTIHRINYRLTIGAAAIIFGSSVVIFHVMIALFY